MRITSLGHAGLHVETRDQRILIDPVFADTLAGGAVEFNPARRFALDRMPAPTALVVSHLHFDHFHPATLEGLERDLPVFAPQDPRLLGQLQTLGFRRVVGCAPWQQIEIGHSRMLATPSAHHEPEFGIALLDADGSFWDMVDSEVARADGARLARRLGRIDAVAAKYQPAERASMGCLRTRGARFDKSAVVGWLEAACAVDPCFVFPHASGFCFAGRHAWFNRYAFPFSSEEIVELLGRRLGADRAGEVLPGDVIEIRRGAPPEHLVQASPFVTAGPPSRFGWEPVEASALPGLDDPGERAELRTRLERFLNGRLQPWLRAELGRVESPLLRHRANGVVWQLVVEAGGGERIEWFIDYVAEPPCVAAGRHRFPNDFTHLSGLALLEVLRGRTPAQFWLVGDARSYEKTIGLADGRLFAPAVAEGAEDEPGDPVTFYLRHFGPDAEGRPMAPMAHGETTTEPDEIEVLARQGESRAVLSKKILLCLLAARDAARLGHQPGEADVQAASDAFRRRFGLEDAEEMSAWLAEAGLELADYSRAMYGFAAVSRMQAHWSREIESLFDTFAKIASIRSRDR